MNRTKQSIKNIIAGIGSQIFLAVISFFTTRLIKVNLGFEYLGINGVFTNIIAFMSLTELGIGAAIVFALYKPLAENDTKLISIIMRFYKNAYRIISLVVFIIGLIIIPFLHFFVNTTLSMNYVREVFLLFVLNSSFSYLLSYKRNLIFADQKNYIITLYTLIFSIISKIGQLTVFVLTKSYVLYLTVNILCTVGLNLLISWKADKLYPYLKDKISEKLPADVRAMLVSKIKALFLHSVGTFCVAGTDNILISYFFGVSEVGKYTSYITIVTLITTLANQLYDGISSSVGNFLVEKDSEEKYELFKKIELINSILTIFVSVCLAVLLTPFVRWWLGDDSTLSDTIVYLIVASNFLGFTRKPIGTIKNAAGLFEQDKFAPLIESFINLVASCIFAKLFGLAGIVVGTIISSIAVQIWVAPKIVYKNVFHKNLISYFFNILRNLFYSICLILLIKLIISHIFLYNQTITLIIYFIISGIICCVIEYFLFFKNQYFIFFKQSILNKIFKKGKSDE